MEFNIFGRKIKIFKSPSFKGEIGETGTRVWGGFLDEDEYRSDLKGSKKLERYDRMRRGDGVVRAILSACTLPIRSVRWEVEPASEDSKDQEVADFVSKNLFEEMTITWDDFLRQALLMLPFGFSVFEKVFEPTEDRKIRWRKFAFRKQKSIEEWKTENGEDGIIQRLTSGETVSIPIEKLLIFTYNKEGDNWEGVSILRGAHKSWWFKERVEKIYSIGYDRQALGIPYAKLPDNATEAEKDEARKILKNVRASESAYWLIPSAWQEFGFIDAKGYKIVDPDKSIKRWNREMFVSVLAQFLDLGAGNRGSYALSKNQSAIFHNNLSAIARQVAEVINKYAIKQLVDFNFNVEDYPRLRFGKIGQVEMESLSKSLLQLIQAGVIEPDEELENFVRQVGEMPEKKDNKEAEEKPKEEPKEKEPEIEEIKTEGSDRKFSPQRKLTFAERKVEFSEITERMNKAERRLKNEMGELLKKIKERMVIQAQRVLGSTSREERKRLLEAMEMPLREEYREKAFEGLKQAFEYGKAKASQEMKKSPPPTDDRNIVNLEERADIMVSMAEDEFLKAVKMEVLNELRKEMSEKKNFDIIEGIRNVGEAVGKVVKTIVNNVPSIIVAGGINQGRRSVYEDYEGDIYALQRSEVLDGATCNYCASIDKRVYNQDDSFTKVDQIHTNCRGIWVSVLKEETEKPKIGGMPNSLRKMFQGLNKFKLPSEPLKKKYD